MLLALGPLVVSSVFAVQRAGTERAHLDQARELRAAAMASFSLGRMEANLDLERTFMLGTVEMVVAGVRIEPLVPVLGGDPRVTVAQLAGAVDSSEANALERLRAAGDSAGAIELARLLVPRRTLLAEAVAGTTTAAKAADVYDELEAFLDGRKAQENTVVQMSARAAGVDPQLLGILDVSNDLDTWSGSVAEQAEQLSALLGAPGDLQPAARSKAGAAVIAGDAALARLQGSSYLAGSDLRARSSVVTQYVSAREDLLDATGMGNVPTFETDPARQMQLLGAYAKAASQLLGAATPVYAAVDHDTVHEADTFVQSTKNELYLAVVIALGVIVLAVVWVLVLARRITKPLVSLGRRAREVSNGQLSDDRIGAVGPSEIATLALAFDEVCSNLRLVEHKAEALAAGRMDDEVLTQRVPGLLGRSLQQSIARVSELTERLAEQARRDPMTGLPNRGAVLEHLNEALHRRERSDDLLAVLFIDLDGFKIINDAYGHVVGDVVLREMAARFRDVGRANEMVARLGGDEFVVVAEGVRDAAGAIALGRRLIETAERPIAGDEAAFTLSASVGVAIAQADSTPMGLLGDADQAVYQAKREGKARVQLFNAELQTAMMHRTTLERDLRRALTADELDIYVQPVVDASSGELHGAEALVRWRRPGHGVVVPAVFIPIAEESWLIVEIGRVVLDKACRVLADWANAGRRLTMSVNIAGRHLVEADLVGDVRDALDRHGAPAELLVVELTESQLVSDLERAATVLRDLHALGVHVALDDFGTGYSSLNYLRQLPIDTIKIDRSYINELTTTADTHALIAGLIHLADSLRVDVVAEGVETAEQADQLRAIGCPKLQGFLIARPMPVDQFAITAPLPLG